MKQRYSIRGWVESSLPLRELDRELCSHMPGALWMRIHSLQRRAFMLLIPARKLEAADDVGTIVRGSAIVGAWVDARTIEVYYEGGLNHSPKPSFEEKCFMAASRFIERYPTMARASVPADSLKQIGTFSVHDDYTGSVVDILDSEIPAWEAWTGEVWKKKVLCQNQQT